MFCAVSIFAQRQTVSPFSRYGYGELYSNTSAYNVSMGGVGVGIQNPVQINFANPAQQSAIKKESFLFNVGLGGNFRNINDNGSSAFLSSVGLESLSMAFPIIENRWGCAIGVLPFNSVGYKMQYSDDLADYSYEGDGGINQFMLSTGVRVFKGLSLGVSAAYVFGVTDYLGENTFAESSAFYSRKELEYKTLGFLWNAGCQYKYQINEEKSIVLGMTFRSKQQLTYRETEYFGSYVPNGDSEVSKDTAYIRTNKSETELPFDFNIGLSFNSENKYLLCVDAGLQDWEGVSCYGKVDDNLQKTKYVKLGGEWIPDFNSTKFYKKMPFRMGVHYSQLPVGFERESEFYQVYEYGVSLGSRIKSKQTQNSLAIAFDFGKRGNFSLAESLQETYLLIKLNVTLQEVWFTKRKIN